MRVRKKYSWLVLLLIGTTIVVQYFAYKIDEFARQIASQEGESDVSEVIYRSVILNHNSYFVYALTFLALSWAGSFFFIFKGTKIVWRILLAILLFVVALFGEMLFYKSYFTW